MGDIKRRDNGSVGRLAVAWRGDRRRSELLFFISRSELVANNSSLSSFLFCYSKF
jgi:hypothetical protein